MFGMHPSYPNLTLQTERVVLEPESEREFPELGVDFEVPLYICQLEGGDLERLNQDLYDISSSLRERFIEYGTWDGESSRRVSADTDFFTQYDQFYNIFCIDDPAIETLFFATREAHERMLDDFGVDHDPTSFTIQGWGNLLHPSQNGNFGSHTHINNPRPSYMTANYCVNADSETATVMELPGPYSEEYKIVNQPGQMSFFPVTLPHYTTPETRDRWRATISSNIIPIMSSIQYDDLSSLRSAGGFGRHQLPFYLPPHLWAEMNGHSVHDFMFVHGDTVDFLNLPQKELPDDGWDLSLKWDL